MIEHPAFAVEPWAVRETELHLDVLEGAGSIFALANGHIGLRGNLDESEPAGLPGTYLNGFYERRPQPYSEAGYGDPQAGQAAVNVTNGKIIRLLVDDEPFDVRFGELHRHERTLDLRAGVLRRRADWRSPTGRCVRISSTRLVSFVQRAVAAVLYEVEPLESAARLVVQSELVANEPMPAAESDPRVAEALGSPLRSERFSDRDLRAVLVHITEQSRLRMAAAMDHLVTGPPGTEATTESAPDLARVTVTADAEPGQRLTIVKLLAYGWSSRRTTAALLAQVVAALAEARHTGWEGLLAEQRAYLDDFWAHADIELEGDAELQQAVRFALFHTLQAGARGERRAIAAKGLTGPGYDGHAFWDSESFVLPVLTYTLPRAAGDALRWRHSTLPAARERARLLGLRGAAFPWRTIDGLECSGYWPASTAAFHIAADIADAVGRYQAATDDRAFEREVGLELLVETARLWRSLGHWDSRRRFRIDGVTGPDEYSALADNNLYTNLMAQRNLLLAADAAERHGDRAAELGVEAGEAQAWREAARSILVPYDERLGVHPQAEGFTEHEPWDFERTPPDRYPLMLHYPYFDLYRRQVVKQADLVLALHLRGDAFTAEEKARDFAYYEALTVRDSSLSACTQAIVAAEVGHVELAYDYFAIAALMDLDDLQRNTRDGLHIAALAGTWLAAVAGLGGMRDHDGKLSFAPRLPRRLTRLAFGMLFRGRSLRVEVAREEARYSLLDGRPLTVAHHGEPLELTPGRPVARLIPPASAGEAPSQPPGREPWRWAAARRPGSGASSEEAMSDKI
ncbi:MAG: family 65 glycosyl hydrolase [Solirubrobacteraceae bacterium]|nr:family 65 glycosyl hydrolase [Solirubrobacteraceae bacterium]